MNKEEVRREFLKLKNKGYSYAQCRNQLKALHGFEASKRTFIRWSKRFETTDWNLRDDSTRPHVLHVKITPAIRQKVLCLREQTGWGQSKLFTELKHLSISEMSIKRILKEERVVRHVKTGGGRRRWVRWQRAHPNSLWQVDHTDEQELFDGYTLSVLDDCSRYSLALVPVKRVTTDVVKHVLDRLIAFHGRPRQILTDNGSAYGLRSPHSKFDRWCKNQGIDHVRSKPHCPTTTGKVERLFKTIDEEIKYCNYDFELFRLRYNHFRPHASLNNKTPAQVYYAFSSLF